MDEDELDNMRWKWWRDLKAESIQLAKGEGWRKSLKQNTNSSLHNRIYIERSKSIVNFMWDVCQTRTVH